MLLCFELQLLVLRTVARDYEGRVQIFRVLGISLRVVMAQPAAPAGGAAAAAARAVRPAVMPEAFDGKIDWTGYLLYFEQCANVNSFQRLMAVTLSGLQWKSCLVYIDGVIVFSTTFEEHIRRLEEVFDRLSLANLRLKPSKCFLFKQEVEFLGHVVTPQGVRTDPAKVAKVLNRPTPSSVSEVRSFLGFCGYYRRFIKNFSILASPLHALTKGKSDFAWSTQCTLAFELLKGRLSAAPVLAYPQFGVDAPQFVVDVDACGTGLGAVVSQESDGLERPIAFASRVLSDSEKRYASWKCEMLALVWAIRHFRCYLLGPHFLVRTDHRSLEYWRTFKEPSAILARWHECLSEFEFSVRYRAGRQHGNADGLSRQSVSIAVVEQESVLPAPFVQRRQWGSPEWRDAQQNDPELVRFREWLAADPRPDDFDLTGASPDLHMCWRGRQQFFLREGVVCRRWDDPCPSRPSRELIVVPLRLRRDVLAEFHDCCCHQGSQRTYQQIRARFHWNGMKRDVEDWVTSCVSCSEKKSPRNRGRGAPLEVTWAGYPFERIAMDLIPNLPESVGGNRHILVVVDYFTKWVEAYPLKRMDAVSIASVFVSEFVSRFGAPDNLHTDQGKNFDSRLFKEVCSMLGVRKTRTTAYHPAGDGLVERFNQTLERVLAHYVTDHQRD